tara:strand:+ start:131 stop:295 length:165 start_codon:yes stop_codon:yes gene_type:complete
MKAKNEVIGIDANKPAKIEDFFAISETVTIRTAVSITLIEIYSINNFFHKFYNK